MTQVKVRSLFAELGFEIKNLKAAQEFEDAVQNIRSGMEQLASVAKTVAVAIIGAGTALTVLEAKEASAAAQLKRVSEGLGVNVENLQALQFAYKELGIEQAELIDSFQKLSDRVIKAAAGSKEYQRILKMVGLSSDALKGMGIEQMYQTVLDKVTALETPQKKLAALTGLFGETLARKLTPALANGGDALKRYIALAHESGLVMSEEQVAAMAELDFQFMAFRATLQSLKKELALALLPTFDRVLSRLRAWWQANKELVKTDVAKFAEKVADATESAVGVFKQINAVVQQAGGWFRVLESALAGIALAMVGKVGNALVVIGGGFKALFVAISAVGGKLAFVLLLVALSVLAMASAWDEMAADARGAETLLGNLAARFDELPAALKVFTILLQGARAIVLILGRAFTDYLLPSLKRLKPVLIAVGIVVMGLVAAVITAIASFILWWTAIITVISHFIDIVSGLVMALKDMGDMFIELVAHALDPTEESMARVREEAAQLFESLASIDALDFLLKSMDIDLRARATHGRTLGGETPKGMPGFLTPAAAGTGAGAGARNSTTTIKVEQKNEFNVSGSMDDKVGQKVAREAGAASKGWANSVNNAARGGNR